MGATTLVLAPTLHLEHSADGGKCIRGAHGHVGVEGQCGLAGTVQQRALLCRQRSCEHGLPAHSSALYRRARGADGQQAGIRLLNSYTPLYSATRGSSMVSCMVSLGKQSALQEPVPGCPESGPLTLNMLSMAAKASLVARLMVGS